MSRIIIGYITEALLHIRMGEGIFFAYNSVIVFPAALCLFMAFINLQIKKNFVSKMAVGLGSSCFGVYLLTDNRLIRESLWEIINLPSLAASNLPNMCGSVVIVVLLMFFVGCVLELFRKTIMRLLKLEKLLHKADNIANVAVEWVTNFISIKNER